MPDVEEPAEPSRPQSPPAPPSLLWHWNNPPITPLPPAPAPELLPAEPFTPTTDQLRVYGAYADPGITLAYRSGGSAVNKFRISYDYTNTGFYIYDITNSATRLYINNSGNVGIGLTPVANNGILQLNSYGSVQALMEKATISATAATGTIDFDAVTQSVLYYTSDATADWTLNIRGSSGLSLDSMMQIGQSLTVAHLVTQGATAYYNSAVQVDGASVTPKWQGGAAPSAGNASGVDVYVYTVVKTASTTFTVFASQTQFA